MELATPGSAVRFASVATHVTDCSTWPGSVIVAFPGHTHSLFKANQLILTSMIHDMSLQFTLRGTTLPADTTHGLVNSV